jgi:hypothetical protein
MGLEKKPQGNYLRLTKEGKFILGKNVDDQYDEFTGKLVNLSFKNDEYEGKVIRKLVLTLEDAGQTYLLSFAFDSSYSSSFVSFIKNADFTKEITLVPVSKTDGDKTTRSLLVKQDGEWLKSYFTKDNGHGQPSMKKVVKKSGKVEWDKEDFLEFRENVINNELIPAIKNTKSLVPVSDMSTDIDEIEDEDTGDDLPF